MRRDLPDFEKMIESDLSSALGYAIDLLAYQFTMPLAMRYARRSVEMSSAILGGSRDANMPAEMATPEQVTDINNLRRAPSYRDLAYAQAIVSGGPLDPVRLREAVDRMESTFTNLAPRKWHVTDQWNLHAAALVALVSGDHERACALLASKRSFKTTQTYHEPLKRVANGIAKHGGRLPPGSDEGQEFQRLFDIFRQPEPNAADLALGQFAVDDSAIRRLEFALTNERYVTGNTGAPDWKRVFESICPPR